MKELLLIKQIKYIFMALNVVVRGPIPDDVKKVSDNEVCAVYGKYKQTWTAEGSGDERHNFVETIEEVES